MPFQITDPELDERLDHLAAAQPIRTSRTSMATAILKQAVEAFEGSSDPDAWRFSPSTSSAGAQGMTSPSSVDPATQLSTSPVHGDSLGGAATPPNVDAARENGLAPVPARSRKAS